MLNEKPPVRFGCQEKSHICDCSDGGKVTTVSSVPSTLSVPRALDWWAVDDTERCLLWVGIQMLMF